MSLSKMRIIIVLSMSALAVGIAVMIGALIIQSSAADGDGHQDLSIADGNVLIDDSEKEFLLGYLDGFDQESLTGTESAVDIERVTRINAMIQEYRSTVDSLYGKVMSTADYEAGKADLMDIFHKLLRLAPHQTPEEDLCVDMRRAIGMLEENIKHIRMKNADNAITIERCIDDLAVLSERLQKGELSYETAKQEYRMLLEGVRDIFPFAYEQHFPSGQSLVKMLMDIERGDLPTNVYGTLGVPHRYGAKSVVSNAFYAAVYYDITDTVEAVVTYHNDTAEAILNYENGVDEVYLRNFASGETLFVSEIHNRSISGSDKEEYYVIDTETGAEITLQQWMNG